MLTAKTPSRLACRKLREKEGGADARRIQHDKILHTDDRVEGSWGSCGSEKCSSHILRKSAGVVDDHNVFVSPCVEASWKAICAPAYCMPVPKS